MGVLPSLRPQPLPFTMAGGEAAGAPAPIVQVVTDLDDGTRPAGVGVAGLEWAETVNGRQCNVFRPSPGVERPAVQPLDATSVPFDASGPGPSIPSPGEGRWVAAVRPTDRPPISWRAGGVWGRRLGSTPMPTHHTPTAP